MKLFGMVAAVVLTASGVVPTALSTPAEAQHRTVVHERTVIRHAPARFERRVTTRRVCTTRFRNGHRIRTCRTVRVRR